MFFQKSEFLRNFPKGLQMLPIASVCIRMYPNASEKVRTGPNGSEHVRKLFKTCESFVTMSKKIRRDEKTIARRGFRDFRENPKFSFSIFAAAAAAAGAPRSGRSRRAAVATERPRPPPRRQRPQKLTKRTNERIYEKSGSYIFACSR